MKNWSLIENDDIEIPENIIKFLNEITEIYKKYNLSLSHEDCHGSGFHFIEIYGIMRFFPRRHYRFLIPFTNISDFIVEFVGDR